jgi:signal peptide peptidase SppA
MIQKILNKPLMIAPNMMLDPMFWFVPGKDELNIVASDVGNLRRSIKDDYRNREGISIIPIQGLLTRQSGSDFFGTTSYEEIHELISNAIEDSAVNSILLDIDSPGGEVSGLFDLVDFIYESREVKPIYAIANDHAFSAAYAIASAASKIFVNRTSGVGSIGVIATHADISEYDKKEGIKYTTIFAGNKKNDLSPHEPISDDTVSDLQKEVDRLYKMFVATVARNRNGLDC